MKTLKQLQEELCESSLGDRKFQTSIKKAIKISLRDKIDKMGSEDIEFLESMIDVSFYSEEGFHSISFFKEKYKKKPNMMIWRLESSLEKHTDSFPGEYQGLSKPFSNKETGEKELKDLIKKKVK